MGLGRAKNVEKLSEKEAIELGGEMLGEFVVFSIAAVILILEYQRGARKEAAKEEKLEKELSSLKSKVQEMKTVTDIQTSQIKDLQRNFDFYKDLVKPNKGQERDLASDNSSYVKKIFGS